MSWLLFCACTCAPPPAPPSLPVPKPPASPNFLVIVADDLGVEQVGAYDENPLHPPTPTLDALAEDGVLFRNAYANPVCSSSRAALLTGRYGRRTGIGGVIDLDDTYELPLDEVTLAEALDREAYESVALGKWHLSGPSTPSGALHPNLQGFDHYAGAPGQLIGGPKRPGEGPGQPYFRFEKVVDGRASIVGRYATTDTTDDAIAWLGKLEPPWFLYIGYHAPHIPLHIPPAELVEAPRDRSGPPTDHEKHAAAVQALDEEIGRLLDALTPEQRAETLILFVGDNGTDPDVTLPPLRGEQAKGTVFEGGTNVPFIVSGPMVTHPGVETGALVHLVDVLPTFAELAQVGVTDIVLDGTSFASVLRDPTSAGMRRMVYTERFTPAGLGPYDVDWAAVRDDRYKIVNDRKNTLFFDLQGRFDDGPPRRPDSLEGEERDRYDALVAELNRVSARSSPR